MPKQIQKQGRNWYALHTYSGYEDTVARNLRQRIESLGMQDKIFQVLVPTEKRIQKKRGKKEVVEEKVYPGYVLVEMIVDDDSWYTIRNTAHVTGFVGAGNVPVPISEEEIKQLTDRMKAEEPEYKIEVGLGDVVKIKTGPFRDREGKVAEVDEKSGRLKVLVDMFGRETPVELDYLEVEKI
jgi:transcriptional antiterminator NusG